MVDQLVKLWLALNEPYRMNHYYGQDAAGSVRFVGRKSPLLLTAPHAVHHYRSEAVKDKMSDAMTGGLCELLGQKVPASSLAASGFVKEWYSWEERNDAFKQKLEAAVQEGAFVIDLHGMSDKHNVDICLGLGSDPSEKTQRMAEFLQKALQPLNVSIGSPFDATPPFTVTSFVQSMAGNCIQMEIAAYLRDLKGNPAQAEAFAKHLAQVLSEMTALLSKNSN